MKWWIKYIKILLNLALAAAAVVGIVYFLPKLIIFFMPFVVGWVIASIANPLVRFLEKRLKIVRKHGSMLVIILALAVVILGGYFAIAKLVSEAGNLIANMPEIYANMEAEIQSLAKRMQHIFEMLPLNAQLYLMELNTELDSLIESLISSVSTPTFQAAGKMAKNLPGTIIAVIISILSSYLFVADREQVICFARKMIPKLFQERVSLVIDNMKFIVGGYFKAQFKIMGVVAVILLIGLGFLKVKYAVLLAALIAFLDMLPFFGTGTALLPWAVLKFLNGEYQFGFGLLIIYGVSQLVRQLIQPKIVGDTFGLNPLLTLIFMYTGYRLKGIFGMIIAVPVGMIVINMYQVGIFDSFIRNMKEIINDINEFRKW